MVAYPNGKVLYETIGTAPNRVFVVEYNGLQPIEISDSVHFQIQLFETSNRIEVHCQNCPDPEDEVTQGIENRDGSKGYVFGNRTNSQFSLMEDGVAFTPFTATPISQTEIRLNFPTLTANGTLSRSTDGFIFSEIASGLPAGTTSFTDIELDPYTEYHYILDGAFDAEMNSESFALRTETLTAPFTNLVATATSATSVELSVDDPTEGFDSYMVQINTSAEGPFITLDLGENEGQIENLLPGTTYYFRVGALTSFGHVSFSNVASATTTLPRRVYVDLNATGTGDGASWANAYTSLNDALDNQENGDEFWIAAGTYYGESGEETYHLNRSQVKLYGGFSGNENSIEERDVDANPTILSGDAGVVGDPTDNYETVVYIDVSSGGGGEEFEIPFETAPLIPLSQDAPLNTAAMDASIILDGLIIQDASGSGFGGGIAIDADELIIRKCIIRNNSSYNGGGIYIGNNDMKIEIYDSQILDNTASGYGGGINLDGYTLQKFILENVLIDGNTATEDYGGGIFLSGEDLLIAEMNDVIITNNSAGQGGGGVYMENCSAYIVNSEISDNTATFNGGGAIYTDSFGFLNFKNVTINNNQAFEGGGFYIFYPYSDIGFFDLTNSTVSNNSSLSGPGGGIYIAGDYVNTNIISTTLFGNISETEGGAYAVESSADQSIADFKHVTISHNEAGTGGGGIYLDNGSGSEVSLSNTIISNNTDTEGYPNISGNLISSSGFNIIEDVGLQAFSTNTTGDQYGDPQNTTTPNEGATESATAINPFLGPLADNHGTTQTMALLEGSPAIDAGSLVEFHGEEVTGDQRGLAYRGEPDIGAFEVVNFEPALDPAQVLQMTSIPEDANPDGDLIQDLEVTITDLDGPGQGIAIIDADNTNGSLQYSIDNGSSWTDVLDISTSNALLLPFDARIRFVPDPNFNGAVDPIFTFRGWDQSEGTSAGRLDASSTGFNTPFSTDQNSVSITIDPVNDAPTVMNPITDQSYEHGFESDDIELASTFVDIDLGDVLVLSAESSHENVVTVTISGTVLTITEKGSGSSTITVTANDGEASAADMFNASVEEQVLGIEESVIKFYPNPGKNYIAIKAPFAVKIEIYDLNGRLQNVTRSEDRVDISALEIGMYVP